VRTLLYRVTLCHGARAAVLRPTLCRVKARQMFTLANPHRFLTYSGPLVPWTAGLAAVLLTVGVVWGLVFAPPDYQMGDTVRIMFVHVPSAWMAMAVYTFMASASLASFIWRHSLADIAARAAAPLGLGFNFLALVTGALWGQPMWGTFWVWDARLTSFLVLFFFYIGYIAVWEAIEDPHKAGRAASVLAIIGFINVPIVKFSVDWWYTLHQSASLIKMSAPSIHWTILTPLLIMVVAYTVLFVALVLMRMRTEIFIRQINRLQISAAQGTRSA